MPNTKITATADTGVVIENTTLTVAAAHGVLSNDTAPAGQNLTVTNFSVAGRGTVTAGNTLSIPYVGTLTINPDGSYSFAPLASYTGAIPTVAYTVTDTGGDTTTSTLNLSITPTVLSASPDYSEVNKNTTLIVDKSNGILANDLAPVGQSLTVTGFTVGGIFTAVTELNGGTASIAGVGTLTINTNGSYSFVPASGFTGEIPTVTYTVADTGGDTAAATLGIGVTTNQTAATFVTPQVYIGDLGYTNLGDDALATILVQAGVGLQMGVQDNVANISVPTAGGLSPLYQKPIHNFWTLPDDMLFLNIVNGNGTVQSVADETLYYDAVRQNETIYGFNDWNIFINPPTAAVDTIPLNDFLNYIAVAKTILGPNTDIAVDYSPNGQTLLPWSSSAYNDIRTMALAGGALMLNAPPLFFRKYGIGVNTAEYVQFTADEILWAQSNHVAITDMVNPEWGDDTTAVNGHAVPSTQIDPEFLYDTQNMIKVLEQQYPSINITSGDDRLKFVVDDVADVNAFSPIEAPPVNAASDDTYVNSLTNVALYLASVTDTSAPVSPDYVSILTETVPYFEANKTTLDATYSVSGFAISDTATNVSSDLNALNADPNIRQIDLTDPGVPNLKLTVAQAIDDTVALREITNASYTVTIFDNAADISAGLDALASDPSVASIVISDSARIAVTIAQLTRDSGAIGLFANANGSAYNLAVSDTAANVSAGLPILEAYVARLSSVVHADGTVAVSMATYNADRAALDLITGGFEISDTAANISVGLGTLESDADVSAIIISNNSAVAVTVAQLTSDSVDISKLANANGSAYKLAVSDTSANLSAGLSILEAETEHLSSLTATSGTLAVSVATYNADRAVLDLMSGGFAISDTAKNISAGLSTLESDANVASIAISDNAILSLTASEVIADSAALAELANANSAPYLLDISGSQTDIVNDASAIDALLAGRHVADVTQSNADGSSVVSTYDIGGKAYSETVADFSASGSLTSVDFVGLAYAAGDHVTFAPNAGGGGTFAIETAAGATVATYATSATYAAGLYKVAADGSGDAMMRPGGATPYDFTNGGHADILWRDAANGATYLWEMNGATVTSASASTSTQVGANWRIEGVADFNNDGAADLLWEYLDTANSSDPLNGVYYISQQNGPSTIAGSGLVEQLSTQWKVAGVGDFSGNGMSDILFRNASTGQTYIDMMNGSSVNWAASGFTSARATNLDWSVAAIGDFTGDGDSDILWRYDNVSNASDPLNGALYEWDMNGTTVVSQGLLSQQPGSANWQVEGTGDFTGNGRSDILFRYEDAANASDPLNGATYIDFMNGANVTSGALTQWQIGNTWQVAGIGDYYGTGKSDILFQNVSSGSTYIWEMNGANVVAGASTSAQLGAGWTTQNGVLIG